MYNMTEPFVIAIVFVNIISSILIIYSSIEIKGDKITYQTNNINNTNITNSSLNNMQDEYILYEQIFITNNTNSSINNETTEKTESFLSTTHQPLFFLGIFSNFSIFF